MTKSIPFSLSIPTTPNALDEMDAAEFDAMLLTGLADARAYRSRPASDVFSDLRRKL